MWMFDGPAAQLSASLPKCRASVDGAYAVVMFLQSGRTVQFVSAAPARKLREWLTSHPEEGIERLLAAGRFRHPTRVGLALKDVVAAHQGPPEALARSLLEAMTRSPYLIVDEAFP